MNVLASLRSRIFLSTALLAVLAIGIAVLLVSVRVTREAENAMQRELLATGAVVEQLRTTQAQTFTTMARLIADAPKLKAAVDTSDPPTVQDVVTDYQTELNSNLLLVTDRMGTVLATVGFPAATTHSEAVDAAVRAALGGRETLNLLPLSGGVLQLVTVPIAVGLDHPDILGTLSVGFLFDEALAQRLKQITGSDIAFGLGGSVLTTTLRDDDRGMLDGLLRQVDGSRDTLHTDSYDALPIPLAAGDTGAASSRPVALILRSRTEQLALLRAIRTELALTGLAAVLLATILSFAVARTITRPLAAITDTMREVASTGDLTRKIVLRGDRGWEDADARLLAATFNTLTESIARFQREISQRERLSSLGRLSTVIAHEVRNPLMIIKTALHTLRRAQTGDPAMREAIADIDGEVARLNRVVNDVLDFSRPIRFELANTDLNAICRASAAAAQASPGAAVHLDLDPAIPHVVTDADRLRIALVNLVENARHAAAATAGAAAPPGTAGSVAVAIETPPAVQLRTRASGSRVAIRITDQGAGIHESDLGRIFDPYFTTRRGGTGLGLPIAKNIIEGLGGSIAVSTTPGRGTAIQIDLPVVTATGS